MRDVCDKMYEEKQSMKTVTWEMLFETSESREVLHYTDFSWTSETSD